MREIKFRGWNRRLKRMNTDNQQVLEVMADPQLHMETTNGEFVIMQFTGLHDKNSQEIYEGDIIIFFLPDGSWSEPQDVRFHRGSFVAKSGILWGLGFVECHENLDMLEVIGNIYLNPELLEVKK